MVTFAPLKQSVAEYLRRNSATASIDGAAETIEALLADADVTSEWDRMVEYPLFDSQMALSLIIETKKLASWNKELPRLSGERAERFTRLKRAAGLLREFYDQQRLLDGTDERTSQVANCRNDAIIMCRSSLAWMMDDLQSSESFLARLEANLFPSSQKRKDEHVAFGKMLCARMKSRFGQPFEKLVLAISGALYAKVITIEALQKSRYRDRKA